MAAWAAGTIINCMKSSNDALRIPVIRLVMGYLHSARLIQH
jgi:hypothetical protein